MLTKLESKFYEEVLGFNKCLEFRTFVITKILKIKIKGTKKFDGYFETVSFYAYNLKDVDKFTKRLRNQKDKIVYVGCNTRLNEVKTDKEVENFTNLFFDVEYDDSSDVEKPPLTDKVYRKKLLETSLYVCNKLKNLGIEANVLMESGRGMYVLISFEPIENNKDNSLKVIQLYKNLIKDFSVDKPHKEIKFSDIMSNASRIMSAVGNGLAHNKYIESPKRKILVCKSHKNDLKPLLDKVVLEKKFNTGTIKKSNLNEFDDETFYTDCFEWQLISKYEDLPMGEKHTKIMFQIKCLSRDNQLDLGKMQMMFKEYGFTEVAEYPHEDYLYDKRVIFNWCLKHAKYCLKNKIKVPLPRFRHELFREVEDRKNQKVNDFPMIELKNFFEIYKYIKQFNDATAFRQGHGIMVYKKQLWEKIEESFKDKTLFEYIKFIEVDKIISGNFNKLESDAYR